MLKRKVFDRRNWQRVVGGGEQTTLVVPSGVIVDYRAGEVHSPLVVPFENRTLRILDTGYRWVHYAPTAAKHALTLQLDEAGHIRQLYIDIGEASGVGAEGLPWIDDLYLDVVGMVEVQPGGEWHVTKTEVLDEDELDEALRLGHILPKQYTAAWSGAHAVLSGLKAHTFAPLDVLRRYLQDPYT
ncbi:DUF402 domain-containing protein [Deinococcus detaillensis]|uniref:DUF402 domain-containing protein n=1 Tax=Deinococcus detaillensis TaxID=2592048 RepID=UPI001CDC9614|nr:DUF402 domain-containing protein [Deinococcus detaillensis]